MSIMCFLCSTEKFLTSSDLTNSIKTTLSFIKQIALWGGGAVDKGPPESVYVQAGSMYKI